METTRRHHSHSRAPYGSGPQAFWHQRLVSWKTISPRKTGGRDGSGGNVSDGEQWGAADEASPARPPLSSCCAARFLTDWSAAGGLGTPALWDQARPLRGSLRGIAPLLSSLPFPASLQVSPGSTFSRNPLHRDPHSRGCFQGPHLRPESTYQAKQCAGG